VSSNLTANILIVDDNPDNREVLSRRLLRRGYQTHCVEDGKKALEAIRANVFDLVLLDIMMPGLDGIEVLSRIRVNFSKTELPIIMVTSKSESEDIVSALQKGANDYVLKPLDFPVALARIEKELSQREEVNDLSRPIATHAFSLLEGEKFGPYLIKEKVGQGGMGAVYKVYDPVLDRIVALKVILDGQEMSGEQVERFKREAKAIARIKHRNIVSIYHIDETPRHYFTMDFIEGENLSLWIQRERISIEDAGQIVSKLASALSEAHENGIIHRDLKSSNVMLDEAGEPHLMDFGLAKLENEETRITRTGEMLGTPEYMAPEQIDPHYGQVDERSDIYSLGVILYEMLTRKAPFSGTAVRVIWQKLNQDPPPPRDHNPDIPAELESICLKALARSQDERFRSAGEFHDALALVI
jgi:serine/threonine protein kinase